MARVTSFALQGIEGYPVQVEVDVSGGLPGLTIVGLPDAAVSEARERVRTALRNSGLEYPVRRITVNLAPADVRKEGPAFDLPIALGLLAATGQVPQEPLRSLVIAGELALDGSVRSVRGVLSLALSLKERLKQAAGERLELLVPAGNVAEARQVPGLVAHAAGDLGTVVAWVRDGGPAKGVLQVGGGLAAGPAASAAASETGTAELLDLADVRGHGSAKRALEVAAAGGHNVLLVGPPGSGKTMLARRLPTLLPPLSLEESLETSRIYSVAGLLDGRLGLLRDRPFRAPHHSVSASALVGGGPHPRPGEVSLAHHGVLFLDELPEFRRDALEALRQPLEEAQVTVVRGGVSVTYPARTMVVAAMNPCPCGWLGDEEHPCICRPGAVERYRGRVSGPLLDRFDLHLRIPRPKLAVPGIGGESSGGEGGEGSGASGGAGPDGYSSEAVRLRVADARQRQAERLGPYGLRTNAEMPPRLLRRLCRPAPEAERLLEAAMSRLHLTWRGYDRVLRLARTIADLEGAGRIEARHAAEAIQYRSWEQEG